MNAAKVVASTAVLVLAVFFGVVLLELLGYIGYVVVFVTPFIAMLAIGIHGIVDGISAGQATGRGGSAGSARDERRIGVLGVTVLKMVAQGKSQQEIAAATSVAPVVIQVKVDALTKSGYLYEGALTEKGFDVLRESA